MSIGLFRSTPPLLGSCRFGCLALAIFWAALSWSCWGQAPVQGGDRFANWIDSAPPGIKRLVDLGQVSFEIDDPELAARKKQGLTIFRFDYRYRYRFSNSDSGDSRNSTIAISARILLTEILLTHRIVVGSAFEPEFPWKSRLLQHEFDHVSISTDPRLRVLLKQVLGAPMKFELPLEAPADQATASLNQRIETRIADLMKERVQEIERVTQAYNDHFDRESNSGARSIHTREEFFRDYFTADSLLKLNFKFPETLEAFAKSTAKSEWKEHYLLNLPP